MRSLTPRGRTWTSRVAPSVKVKPALGFKPKDSEERTIPISDSLLASLKVWRAKNPTALLVFPSGGGRPNGHLLRDLKQVALSQTEPWPLRVDRERKEGHL